VCPQVALMPTLSGAVSGCALDHGPPCFAQPDATGWCPLLLFVPVPAAADNV
jgi:hypothetical protein